MCLITAPLLLVLAPQKGKAAKPLMVQEAGQVFRPYVKRQVPKTVDFYVDWYQTKGD